MTAGVNVTLTNKNWGLIKVTGLEYNSPEWQNGPEPFSNVELGHGKSTKVQLEAYTGQIRHGYSFILTIKVDGALSFKVKIDPYVALNETHPGSRYKLYSVEVVDGNKEAPPTVYSVKGEGDAVEFVVARQADELLRHSGELACTAEEENKYRRWLNTHSADAYKPYSFHGILLASSPPDDRSEGLYNFLRNTEDGQFARLALDTVAWKTSVSDSFFHNLPTPKAAGPHLYSDDVWFGNFPLFGPDPTMIERVVREDQLPALMKDDLSGYVRSGLLPRDFEQKLAANQVYRVDYSRYASLLSRAPSGRFACWPMAIFVRGAVLGLNSTIGQLHPVAIELHFPEEKETPLITPASTHPWTWEMAKRLFLCAAANYHELGAHLAHCHFAMERYALATYRHLPPYHPVGRLLRPHFKFLVATDNDAVNNLINEGGQVDRNFMHGIGDSLKISADALSSWDLRVHGNIEKDLERRGVLDLSAGKHGWTYNVYGRRIYQAIRGIVRSYLRLWYGVGDEVVLTDNALRSWNNVLSSDYGVGEHGLPLSSSDASGFFEGLVTVCTNIIWTCGPQHSAVNYPQFDFFADAYTLPFANYLTGTTPRRIVRPARDRIEDQAQVTARLSAFRYDKLGHYPEDASSLSEYGDLGHPHAPWALVIKNFPAALAAAAEGYPASDSLWGYQFLLPENITNGISI